MGMPLEGATTIEYGMENYSNNTNKSHKLETACMKKSPPHLYINITMTKLGDIVIHMLFVLFIQ